MKKFSAFGVYIRFSGNNMEFLSRDVKTHIKKNNASKFIEERSFDVFYVRFGIRKSDKSFTRNPASAYIYSFGNDKAVMAIRRVFEIIQKTLQLPANVRVDPSSHFWRLRPIVLSMSEPRIVRITLSGRIPFLIQMEQVRKHFQYHLDTSNPLISALFYSKHLVLDPRYPTYVQTNVVTIKNTSDPQLRMCSITASAETYDDALAVYRYAERVCLDHVQPVNRDEKYTKYYLPSDDKRSRFLGTWIPMYNNVSKEYKDKLLKDILPLLEKF